MGRKDECFGSLKEALGEKFDENTTQKILDTLDTLKANAEVAGSFNDFRQTSMQYLKQVKEATVIQKIARARQILAVNQNKSYLGRWHSEFGIKDTSEAIASMLYKSPVTIDGVGLNVESTTRTLRNRYMKAINSGFEAAKIHEIMKTGDIDLHVAKEMYELQRPDGKPGVTNNKTALEAAKIITGVQRMILKDLRETGFPVKDLFGRITQQTHDPAILRKMGKEAWIDKVLEIGLDKEKTFGAEQDIKSQREYLSKAYEDITIGRTEATSKEDILGDFEMVNRDKILAGKFAGKRNIHFADGEAFYKYNQEFGKKNIFSSVLGEIDNASRSIGLAKKFGPDAQSAFDSLLLHAEREVKKNGTETDINKFMSNKPKLQQQFAGLIGPQNIHGYNIVAKVGEGYRSMWRMTNLGMSAITNLADISAHAMNLKANTGKNIFQTHLEFAQELLNIANPEIRQKLASETHLFYEDVLREHARRTGGEPDIPGHLSSMERGFFKLTGLPQEQYAFKLASAKVISRELFRSSEEAYSKLIPRITENLKRYKIGEAEIAKIKGSAVDIGGHPHITPEGVLAHTNDKELSQKIGQYITDYAELVGDPSEGLKYGTFGAGNSNPNDITGQALRMAGVMKTFPQHMQHVATRFVLADPSIRATGLMDAYKTKTGAVSASKTLVGYMVSASTMAYIAWSMKEIAKGKTPPDPTNKDTWLKAMLSSGAGGIYADLIQAQDYNKDTGKGIAKTIAGPVLSEPIFDLPDMYDRIKKTHGKHIGKELLNFGVRHTPGNNLPFVRPTVDYLILNEIQETLNPGYLSKRERYLKGQGQSYLIPGLNKRNGGR